MACASGNWRTSGRGTPPAVEDFVAQLYRRGLLTIEGQARSTGACSPTGRITTKAIWSSCC
jgi:hypothetical protein